MTRTEEILARQARYHRVEYVTDEYGRSIGVKLLKRSQRIKLDEMAPNLSGFDEGTDDQGKTFQIPKIANLIFAASVVKIDDAVFTFPKSRAELDAVVDVLDDAGLQAAAEGFAKLSMADQGEDAPAGKDEAEAAKN